MALNVSSEPIETCFHKNIYPSDIMVDKGKKANFCKACKPFSMFYGQLIYINTRLFFSSTERQHIIISDVYKRLGYDPKAREMALYCGRHSMI